MYKDGGSTKPREWISTVYPDDHDKHDWALTIIHAIVVLMVVFLFVVAIHSFTDNHTYSGVVIKSWAESAGFSGTNHYATIQADDGSRLTIGLLSWEYGQIETGARCTFGVDHWMVAQSMTCDYGGKR